MIYLSQVASWGVGGGGGKRGCWGGIGFQSIIPFFFNNDIISIMHNMGNANIQMSIKNTLK